MNRKALVVDTLGFLSITQMICSIDGEGDETKSYLDYMGVLSYLIAKNGLVHRQFILPEELGNHCNRLWNRFNEVKSSLGEPFSTYDRPFYGIVDLDPNKSPEVA